MRILLVNNSTKHLPNLRKSLAGHDVELLNYRPGVQFNTTGKDLVILSGGGGEGREANDEHKDGRLWYEDEMKFVQSCSLPMIGICMGFEVIARAYGAAVPQLNGLVSGFMPVKTTKLGASRLGKQKLLQLEAHQWHVPEVSSKHFEVLGYSDTGIEIIKHRSRPILATQFHPEAGGTLELTTALAGI